MNYVQAIYMINDLILNGVTCRMTTYLMHKLQFVL